MDLKDQLKNLFPDHEITEEESSSPKEQNWMQEDPILCKYEKRKGKPTTIIAGYEGEDEDFKILAKEIKNKFAVGGSFKDGEIIIQGDYRDKIMKYLQEKFGGGFDFSQVITLRILNPNSLSICPTEKMLCIVPLIQIVASSFILSRTNESHFLLKSFIYSNPSDLSHFPLFTFTIFPF